MSAPGSVPEPAAATVRVALPAQLRHLARISGEVAVAAAAPVTVATVLDALESAHPALTGTIRERETGQRRAMIRIYADGEDYSNEPLDTVLPEVVATGREPLRLVGSIAGG